MRREKNRAGEERKKEENLQKKLNYDTEGRKKLLIIG